MNTYVNKKRILILFVLSSVLGVAGSLMKILHFPIANFILGTSIIFGLCFLLFLVYFLINHNNLD